jgi:alpha-aminoadipic semialdehyde synthase
MSESKHVLGIRREDKNRWERRAPLAPAHVKELVKRGIKVIVQPSSLRTFPDRQYAEVRLFLILFFWIIKYFTGGCNNF